MSDMSRKEAIEVLKDIVSKPMLYSNFIMDACRVALASLETDEAYQLEYENIDCMEVVRCKDCKHYRGNSCEWHNGFKPPVNWFCADGERE